MVHLSTRRRLVVIGNGMAGMRTVEELLTRAPVRFAVTVFGEEPHPNYNRILLSSVLAGEKALEDIVINPRSWYEEHNIVLHTDDPVIAIDRAIKTVRSASGRVVPYDALLIATGSRPLMPPLLGLDLPGVVRFRDIADVETILEAAGTWKRAAVIGGGLLGLEAAWGLKRRGMEVAVVHLMPTLMERQLDAEAGTLLQRDLTERGLHFFTHAQTESITGTTRAEGLRLADGRTVSADLVVVAIGIRPNVALAKDCGLVVNRGIVVGDDMTTSDPAIHAVGECVEHAGQVFGLVAPLWEQAKVCAARLAGDTEAAYVAPPLSTKLKITGIDMFSAGQLGAAGPEDAEVVFRDATKGIYRKLVIRDDRLVGAVLYGVVEDSGWYFDLMGGETDIAPFRDRIIFGHAFADLQPAASGIDVAAMAETAQVCGCNGVAKGTIVAAIRAKGLTTVEAVRAHTKAKRRFPPPCVRAPIWGIPRCARRS
ncbi:MAG: nitrite reductase (NAD(P)H) large subunit [Rhodospirillaceae bacterium]|nr:MAG: nitrite reductase (NAD(P)H) large subunit [Rhodospirillaceae bacterium]